MTLVIELGSRCPGCHVVCAHDDVEHLDSCRFQGRGALALVSPRDPEADEPVHRPYAPEAPIPGVHHYSGCDPDRPTVSPEGVCRGCGDVACPSCGYELCQCPARDDEGAV